MMSRIG